MEENKNNAIEKIEKIVDNKVDSNNNKTKNVKHTSTNSNDKLREKKAERKYKDKKEKAKLKEEKRKAMLAKKEERAKRKEKQAKEAEKLRAEKLKAKQDKKAELKKLKLQKREERLKRKQLLKHETKAERQNRINKEKMQKAQIRKQKLADKKARRSERIEERREKRQLRRQERRDKRRNRRGIGGWLAAVISLGCTVLVLGSLLTLTLFTPLDEYLTTSTQEERSFYDLVGYIDNLDVNLSKVLVSNNREKQQKLLSEVRVQSNLATSSIAMLSLHDEDKFYTTKFINQVGDFSKYLEEKLIDGENLSDKDIETLKSMYKINNQLKNELSTLASNIDENFNFRSIYEGKDDNIVISKFNELESNATEYPRMIYDGAYSDNVNKKEAKNLKGLKEITKLEGEELFKKYFSQYNLKDVTLKGETTSEAISCYNFEGKTEDGTVLEGQITKLGGKLVMFNHYKECESDNYDAYNLKEVANEFLNKLGYKNMKAVWMTEGNHIVSLNYATVVDGVICYSDLIKVNVCKERGLVSGLEASAFILNHVNRELPKIEVTLSEAKSKVSSEIELQSSRLAIIPKGENGETLAYEFTGLVNGELFYVYIDAVTGKEVDIFKVVKTTEGTLIF